LVEKSGWGIVLSPEVQTIVGFIIPAENTTGKPKINDGFRVNFFMV
jgi:hypothetical protein